jgi:hypothetical protein
VQSCVRLHHHLSEAFDDDQSAEHRWTGSGVWRVAEATDRWWQAPGPRTVPVDGDRLLGVLSRSDLV